MSRPAGGQAALGPTGRTRIFATGQRGCALLALAAGLLFCSALQAVAAPAPSRPLVIGYVFPEGKPLQQGAIAAGKLSRINYAFANIQEGRLAAGFPNDAQNIAALVAMKRDHPSLTILISVGGWTWSGGFSDMALTPESRGVFIQSVVDFLAQHQLDGLDVDWEYPGMPGLTSHFRPEDKQNYTLLLSELRARFDQEEKLLHRRLFLSLAAGGESDFIQHTEMDQVQKYVDTVNVMAYDYYECCNDKTTGNHSPLFTDPADPKKTSADQSVQNYEQAGVPADKIVLGVPFYGRAWGQVPDRNHGLFQPGRSTADTNPDFGDIPAHSNPGFTRYWDASASAPYLYSSSRHVFVSYEDEQSLTAKCKYVLSHKLGGIMFWDYESDPSGRLLNTIDAIMNRPARPSAASAGKAR